MYEKIKVENSEEISDIIWNQVKENFGIYREGEFDFFVHIDDIYNTIDSLTLSDETESYLQNLLKDSANYNFDFVYFKGV